MSPLHPDDTPFRLKAPSYIAWLVIGIASFRGGIAAWLWVCS